ncbi:MAG: InlB B-repeat-containing protein, partial [Lentisphaeria bacterium]|nr:InlB B-repeat-containing protein [Lentisphaeria bacterium]
PLATSSIPGDAAAVFSAAGYGSLAELVADFVPGRYRVHLQFEDGTKAMVDLRFAIDVAAYDAGSFPAYVVVEAPAPGAEGVGTGPLLDFDVADWACLVICEDAPGAPVYSVCRGAVETDTHQVPPATLAPGTEYALRVSAQDPATSWLASWSVSTFTTAPLPVVTAFTIDGDATYATSRSVTLHSTCTGEPLECLAGEDADLGGATWQSYAAALPFTLSAGDGEKTVHFRVRNVSGESAVVNDRIVLDTTPPAVVAVTSSSPDGTYGVGATVDVTVTFDEPVQVTGNPQLSLETGSADAVAAYQGGSGTAALEFRFSVLPGHTTTDLDCVAAGALSLNGGSLRDAAGNDAILTVPVGAEAGSLASNADIAIDTHYALEYQAGPGGNIEGTALQVVVHGQDGAPVTAAAADGYHFVSWSDGCTDNPRADTNVQADVSVTAHFAINQYTVVFQPGAHGSLAGGTPTVVITVNHGDPAPVAPAVTPDACWDFSGWAPALPALITEDVATTAQYAQQVYGVTFHAGEHGSLEGGTPDVVVPVDCGDAPPAFPGVTPDEGWLHTGWAPELPGTVTADVATTAQYARITYTLTYTAGDHGAVMGESPQTVEHGSDGSAVTAVPAACYGFVQWSDGSTENPRTDTSATANIAVTAQFGILRYTLTYMAGPYGTVTGPTPQTVDCGADGQAVTAVPGEGYHFVQWSDGVTTATRQDLSVAADLTVTAAFAINEYVVTFAAGPNGSLDGEAVQVVSHGADCSPVTAMADPEYVLHRWTRDGVDHSTDNPLLVTEVIAPMAFVAEFREAEPVPANGPFALNLPAEAFEDGAALWDLSGDYLTPLHGDTLSLHLLHDTKGKITGDGQYTTDIGGKTVFNVPLTVKGGGKGTGGALTVTLGLKGQAVGIPGDDSAKAKVAVKQAFTLDASGPALTGTSVVSTAFGSDKDRFEAGTVMPLPAGADGTYRIELELVDGGKSITGTGMLHLPSGTAFPLLAKGKLADGIAVLKVSGDKADPAAGGIKLTVSIETLEGAWARVLSVSGKAFGQSIAWEK